MTIAVQAASLDAALVVASVLMLLAGIAHRRMSIRTELCPVCRRPRTACTCRWR